jgi:hypothetical protein
MTAALRALDGGESASPSDAAVLAECRLAAKRFLFLADRELMLDSLSRSLEARPQLGADNRAAFVLEFGRLTARAELLIREYSALWLYRSSERELGAVAGPMRRIRDDLAALTASLDNSKPLRN